MSCTVMVRLMKSYVDGKATQLDVPDIDSFWREDSVAFLSERVLPSRRAAC